MSSKRPTFLAHRKWQAFTGFWFHPFPSDVIPFVTSQDKGEVTIPLIGPKHYLDVFLERIVAVCTILADFNEFQKGTNESRAWPQNESFCHKLKSIQENASVVL